MSRMLFGEKTPELPQADVEAYFEDWLAQAAYPNLATVAPHPTDNNFVLRGRSLHSINNGGRRIEQDLVEAAAHHQMLAELGLSIPVYEHAICRQGLESRFMLFTAVERVTPHKTSEDEERQAKYDYRSIIRKYYAHVQDEQLPYFLSDITYPFQGMYGTGVLDATKIPKVQLLDVDPRLHKIRHNDPYYPELFLSFQRRFVDNVSDERWQRFAFAQPQFDENGAFIAPQ